ncbi:hypothetical protein LWI29_037853 [Acer saccharum]|uniref:Jacalin-type lectin domain-containing protein n=1 Tax=Acer saccharum TaxID=4024 RepID=A0AA39RSS3_ACESA|nr:hypothetical protein LWI29_037853 [Acer saccharum]
MAMEAASFNWENPTKKELWGNIKGGHPWNYQPNGAITHIKIRWGSNIDAISFKSTDGNGNWTQFGGSTGREEPSFEIGWPNDYLESITGSYDSIAINTLCFKTHRGKQYGPFGTPNDGEKKINISTKDSTIVGFFGREGALLDALGIYVKPFAEVSPVPLPDLPTPEPLPLVPSPVLPLRQERDIQPAQFILNIKSYSLLPTELEKKYESKYYEFEDYRWKLILYPCGDKGSNGHVSLFLAIDESTLNRNNNSAVYVDLKLFVLNKITNKYLTIRDTKGALMNFDKSRTVHGFSQLLPLDIFENPCNGYLVDDACAFGAEFFVVQPPSRTKQETLSLFEGLVADAHNKDRVYMDADGKSHTWEIKKFMERGHEEVRFNAKDRTWELHMDRTGKHSPNGEFMSLYMKVHDPARKVYLKARLQAVNPPRSSNEEKTISRWFDQTNNDWGPGIYDFLPLSDIDKYLNVEGTLRIKITFDVISEIK